MKKANIRFSIILALAVVSALVSCSKGDAPLGAFRVSATIASDTKLEYSVADAAITPAWKVGDEVFGYDDKGSVFTFTVNSVSEGKAILDVGEYQPGQAKYLYAVYYPGKGVADIEDEAIAVDLSSQSGILNADFPLIMTSTGRIQNNEVSLNFSCSSSILALKQFKVKAGERITSVKITGVTVDGEINSVHGMMDVIASESTGTVTVATDLTADADGVAEGPVFLSVLPSKDTRIGIVAVAENGTEYATSTLIAGVDVEEGNYYYVSKNMGEAVAEIVETGEKFATINNAFERANESTVPVTIKLDKNVTVTDTILLKNALNCLTYIDFNGYKISASLKGKAILNIKSDVVLEDNSPEGDGGLENTYANAESRAIYMRYDKISVTINGGVYASKADDGVAYFRGISSKIVVNGGKFINKRTAGGEAFYIYGSTGISGTINGGSFIDVNGGNAQAIRSGNGAQIKIYGGYFHNGSSTGDVLGQATATGFVGNVYGGFFNKEINSTYIATGCEGKATSFTYEGRTYSYFVNDPSESKDGNATTVTDGDTSGWY